MEGRQRLGAVLVVAGLGMVAIGGAGVLAGPTPTAMQPTPSAVPASAPPTAAPTTVPAVTPTPTPTVAPSEDTIGIVRAFFARLEADIRAGRQGDLADRLAPSVIARYGRAACTTALASRQPVPEQAFEILRVRSPAPWVYETDGFVEPLENITTVDAKVTGPDASGVVSTQERELHVLVIGSTVFWFTDCGEPLAFPSFSAP